MPATIQIPTTFTAKDRYTDTIRKMSRSVKKFGNDGVSAVKRFDHRVSRTFNKLGRLAQIGLGVGAFTLFTSSITTVQNYEQSIADLNAVMNTTSANQNLLLKDSQRLGAITAKSATEVVGLQEAYARLGFPTQDIINMTEATISGSIAMNSELKDTAELTGAMVKTFDDFSSIDAKAILDKMTLSTQKSALSFEKLQTGLPIVAGAANSAGIPFEKLLALMGKLSDAGIDASSSSTALRNIFLDSAKKGLSYEQILKKILKNSDKLTPAMDAFGKRGAVSAAILSQKLTETDELTKTLSDSFEGVADAAAKKRLDTFGGSLTLLQSAWEGLLLKTNENSGALEILKNVVDFVTENLETLTLIVASGIGLFIALKVGIVAMTVATGIYNTVLGISTAITQTNKRALIGNTIAQGAYKTAMVIGTGVTWLATAATTAFGIALNLGLWLILAIIAAVVAVVLVIKNWSKITDWFGEKWKQFTAFISEAWDNVVKWFKEFDFMEFFKNIGKSLLKYMLLPLKGMLALLSKIPGKIGDLAKSGLDKIDGLTGTVEVNNNQEKGILQNSNLGNNENEETKNSNSQENNNEVLPSTTQTSNNNLSETIKTSRLNIDIRDKGGNVEKVSKTENNEEIPIKLTQTSGAF